MRSALPRAIWALGLVSLFMDISSEMIHGLLPVFLVGTLGASALTLGLIEGAAEALASLLKLPSGWLSDRWGKRKPLALLGYGLSALVKPIFALAPGIGWIFAARMLDRAGKGIRGAPRDALIADLAPVGLRGAAFGLRQSLDTVGAFTGPLLAIALMAATGNDIRLVFWLALPPALISVALLALLVPEPDRQQAGSAASAPGLRPGLVRELGRPFWVVLAAVAVFTLGRYGEAFLILRAMDRGLPLELAPLVLVGMNVVYSLAAFPAGWLSDRFGRQGLLVAGALAMGAANLALATTGGLAPVAAGIALWGLHMALTQGVLSALVADAAPAPLRGTAFGIFHLTSGVALLAASAGFGWIWSRLGPEPAFLAAAAIAALATALVFLAMQRAPLERRP